MLCLPFARRQSRVPSPHRPRLSCAGGGAPHAAAHARVGGVEPRKRAAARVCAWVAGGAPVAATANLSSECGRWCTCRRNS